MPIQICAREIPAEKFKEEFIKRVTPHVFAVCIS